jgi:hypothetical protein
MRKVDLRSDEPIKPILNSKTNESGSVAHLLPRGISIAIALFLLGAPVANQTKRPRRVGAEISSSRDASAAPVDGRLFLLISKDNKNEPRFEVGESEIKSQQIFGIDVERLGPDQTLLMDGSVLGYPMRSLDEIPPGDYYAQALLHRYTMFHRADGHIVKLPKDEGEGQNWRLKPGNLYSDVQRIHIDPSGGSIKIEMTHVIPKTDPPKDTKYIKHVVLQSKLLTRFWGQPMYLGAIVLLPDGWDTHPESHFPLIIEHTHFPSDFEMFSAKPPAPTLKGDERTEAEYAYKFYQDWTSGRLPRVLLMEIQHANPYYDDSYAVNSANIGPYGDAINYELMPYVEKMFRGIGQGWARAVYGGSTGGWESFATQVFYPSSYNGAWAMCPDPLDFRAYESVNIYEDQNAFWRASPWGHVPQPDSREVDDLLKSTVEGATRLELVLGTHGRSGGDWNAWQAVFGPVGPDGYPKPIWDPSTGVIDHQVANYWRDHYDLRFILQRDWHTLGPQLVGKIHITVGTRDSFYLDNAVRLTQNFLESTNNPYYAGDIEYGPHQPHCFTGDASLSADIGAMTTRQRILPKAVNWMLKTAPAGADITSWRY